MNQNIASNIQMQEKNDYNDSANYSNPTPKIWFFISYGNWFLSKTEKQQVQGSDSWFNSPSKISQAINRPEKIEKIDLSKIEILVTKDPELLQQYYDLREREYRKKLGFENYNGQETTHDKTGDIMLGVFNGKVVAGARIDFSNKNKSMYNDNPEIGFNYKDIIKKFDPTFQDGDVYSEICGVVDDNLGDKFFMKFAADVMASNGVIHAIDAVILPPGVDVSKFVKK